MNNTLAFFEIIYKNIKYNWLFLLTSIITMIIYFLYEDRIDINLFEYINPIIDLQKSYRTDILIIALLYSSLIYFFYNANRGLYLKNYAIRTIVLTAFYIYLRNEKPDHLISFSFGSIPFIKPLDVIYTSLILFFVPFVKNTNYNNSTKKGEEYVLLEDSFSGGDIYKRSELIESIYKHIECNTASSSFGIGITGPWGSGKTFFIDRLKSKLNNTNNNIIVEFNFWRCKNEQQVMDEFFSELNSVLYEENKQLSGLIRKYSKELRLNDENFYSKLINIAVPTKSNKDTYIDINENLKAINKKLIIFIDDLDRSNKLEIMEVFKIIRNTANFYNTYYITAFDRDYVIKQLDFDRPEKFLEKIFQLEIPLPKFKSEAFYLAMEQIIKQAFPDINDFSVIYSSIGLIQQQSLEVQRKKNKIESIFELYFDSIRDVIRYINLFSIHYHIIKGELCIEEYLLLHLIKFKYPEIYDRLLYFDTLNLNDNKVVDFLNTNRNLQEKEVYSLTHIINLLFLDLNLPQNARSIKDSRNRLIYFSVYLFHSIPKKEYYELKSNKNPNIFLNSLRKWYAGAEKEDLVNILKIDLDLPESNRADFEFSISVIFEFKELLKEHGEIFTSILMKKIYSEDSISAFYPDLNIFNSFLKKYFTNAEYPYLIESSIIKQMISDSFIRQKENNVGEYMALLKQELLEINVDFLKKSFKGSSIFLPNLHLELFENCVENEVNELIIYSKEACIIMKNYITGGREANYFKNVLRSNDIEIEMTKSYYFRQSFFQIFNGYEEFNNVLFSLRDTSSEIMMLKTYCKYYEHFNKSQPLFFPDKYFEITMDEDINITVEDKSNIILEIESTTLDNNDIKYFNYKSIEKDYYNSQKYNFRASSELLEKFIGCKFISINDNQINKECTVIINKKFLFPCKDVKQIEIFYYCTVPINVKINNSIIAFNGYKSDITHTTNLTENSNNIEVKIPLTANMGLQFLFSLMIQVKY